MRAGRKGKGRKVKNRIEGVPRLNCALALPFAALF